MDERNRYITKISRNLELYKRKRVDIKLNSSMELVLHVIRHNNGITQEKVGKILGLDKGLITRITKSLIEEELIYKIKSDKDKRAYLLFDVWKSIHQILFRIYICRSFFNKFNMVNKHCPNFHTVFQSTKLFQSFTFFQYTGRQ